ncbi:MAG: glutamine-hydrolyzing carbamoyl-phosphate synthase small subunit [Conexivisphaerales archaeon]|nr:glutamine-hydrolyzing carbamoyl-phosphate synthase small subunit [Conexivisphaerales archaeon]
MTRQLREMLVPEEGPAAVLALKDGTVLWGRGFGGAGTRVGEVVFTTAMNGYTESLTDPSYRGQILVITHPLVGNYGVPPDFESRRIQVEGLVIAALTEPSHPRSERSLHEWLQGEGIPGIEGVDTRAIVKRIRGSGVMAGALSVAEDPGDIDPEALLRAAREFDYESVDLVRPSLGPATMGVGGHHVVVVDFGIKGGIVRELVARDFKVTVVPWSWGLKEIMSLRPDGIVVGNGPGNPSAMEDGVELVRGILRTGVPTLGICLGHQLVALALGARVNKMKFGHRGINKPVRDLSTGRLSITTHNHGYAVDPSSLDGTGLRPRFVDVDDGTLEGMAHERMPLLTSQFHPEGSPGPRDASYVFDEFRAMVLAGGRH